MNEPQKTHRPEKPKCDIIRLKDREEAHKAYRAALALVITLERQYGFTRKRNTD